MVSLISAPVDGLKPDQNLILRLRDRLAPSSCSVSCVSKCGALASMLSADAIVQCFADDCACPMPQRDQSVPVETFLTALHNSERVAYLLLQTGLVEPLRFLGSADYIGPAQRKHQLPIIWAVMILTAIGFAVKKATQRTVEKSDITNKLI